MIDLQKKEKHAVLGREGVQVFLLRSHPLVKKRQGKQRRKKTTGLFGDVYDTQGMPPTNVRHAATPTESYDDYTQAAQMYLAGWANTGKVHCLTGDGEASEALYQHFCTMSRHMYHMHY